jgi:hypothetical protein
MDEGNKDLTKNHESKITNLSTININPEAIEAAGKVFNELQKTKNNHEIEEIKAKLPFLNRDQIFRYSIIILILLIVSFFSYIHILDPQLTVGIISSILGYIFGYSTSEYFNREKRRK